jgi:hypothetical protein
MSEQAAPAPTKAVQEEASRKFLELAFQAAALPVFCTKFQVMPAANLGLLVLGGGII